MEFWTGIILGLLLGVGGTAQVFMGGHSEVAADCYNEPCEIPPCCNGDVDGNGYSYSKGGHDRKGNT